MHQVREPGEQGIGIRADQYPFAVQGRIAVGWRRRRDCAPGRLLDLAEHAIFGKQAFHQAEHRLAQRHVEGAARAVSAGAVALPQGGHDAEGGIQAGDGESPMLTPTRTGGRFVVPAGWLVR